MDTPKVYLKTERMLHSKNILHAVKSSTAVDPLRGIGKVKWDDAKNDDIGSVHRLTPRSRGPDKELFPEYHARNSVLAFVSRSSIRS